MKDISMIVSMIMETGGLRGVDAPPYYARHSPEEIVPGLTPYAEQLPPIHLSILHTQLIGRQRICSQT